MKITLSYLILFASLFISCNTEIKKQPIKISSYYADYKVDETQAIEENKREDFDLNNPSKAFPIDSSWLMDNAIIEDMSNDDFMVIKYRMQGCFGGESKEIILKKVDSKIFCILGNNLIVQLTEYQIANFRKLESLLYQINKQSTFCTTTVSYKFYFGKRMRTYIDDTCLYDKLLGRLTNNIFLEGIPVKN